MLMNTLNDVSWKKRCTSMSEQNLLFTHLCLVTVGRTGVDRRTAGKPIDARAQSGASGGESGSSTKSQVVLNALRRWWYIALPAGLCCGRGGAIVYSQFEPQYEAAAMLKIMEQAPYIAFETKDAGNSKGYFRTQIDTIKSRWIIGRSGGPAATSRTCPKFANSPTPSIG